MVAMFGRRMSTWNQIAVLAVGITVASPVLISAAWSEQPKVSIRPRLGSSGRTAANLPRTDIQVNTTFVLIPVTVTDPLDRFVTGLTRENFRVYEDNKEEPVSQFFSEDVPVSVGLVVDTSGSMGRKLATAREAVAAFLKTANPRDEFFLVTFNDRPKLASAFTTSLGRIQDRLIFTRSKGTTALLDAVHLAVHQMKAAHHTRKALLVISDGGDNNSRYTESELREVVLEADLQIYSIGIFEPMAVRERTPEELAGPDMLSDLADQTGGLAFSVDDLNELMDVMAKVGITLRNQYVLGYHARNTERDGKYHRVRVKLTGLSGLPPLHLSWRRGFYAPAE